MYFARRNLDYFENCHYSAMTAVDADCGNGELAVKLPQEALNLVQGQYHNWRLGCSFQYAFQCIFLHVYSYIYEGMLLNTWLKHSGEQLFTNHSKVDL